MKRRKLLALGAVAGLAAIGSAYIARPRDHAHLALDPLIDRLSGLDASGIQTASSWDVVRTMNHLAQGVDFSMTAYPEERSKLFQHTVGRTAFNLFQTHGEMSHDTEAPIPGEILDYLEPNMARDRLVQSLIAFRDWEAELAPHFAYGPLDKAAYAKAHVMHVHDHLVDFRVA